MAFNKGNLGVSFRPGGARLARMVWIIALLCMGLVGLAGYRRGPICAVFSLFGLFFGLLLARPLSPLASYLLPIMGLDHPLWQLFVPGFLAFLAVLIIFKIVGGVLHGKMTRYFKYQKDERLYFRWERLYNRLGFCAGLLNGAVGDYTFACRLRDTDKIASTQFLLPPTPNVETCFSMVGAPHRGHVSGCRLPMTSASKRCPHAVQRYSNSGMA